MQAPLTVTPSSMPGRNPDAFSSGVGRGASSNYYGIGDMGQDPLSGTVPHHLPEPKQVEFWPQGLLGGQGAAESSYSCWGQPQVGTQDADLAAVAAAAAVQHHEHATSDEYARQQQQQQFIGNIVQMLHYAGAQSPDGEAFLQETFHEIAKRCATSEYVEHEATDVSSGANPLEGCLAAASTPPPLLAGGNPTPGLNPWACTWGQQAQPMAVQQPYANHAAHAPVARPEEPSRVEELTQYIRSQGQDYVEGQAEWGRQIAEVRSECLRELEKVKREKEEVERQARQEILRLKHRLRDHGIPDEGLHGASGRDNTDSPSRLAPWAAAVSMTEHQRVQGHLGESQERIRVLEQYIKDQAAKQLRLLEPQEKLKEKDEEIQKLRQVIVSNGTELRNAAAEQHAIQAYQQRKLQTWEQGARQLLDNANKLLSSRSPTDKGQLEASRFESNATKLSLNMAAEGKEEVVRVQLMLKDALKKSGDRSKRPDAKAEEASGAEMAPPASAAPQGTAGDEGSTVASESRLQVPGVTSNASSRATSPGSGAERGSHLRNDTAMRADPAVAQVVGRLASDLRQLLAMSQQQGPIPPASQFASRDNSPRSSVGHSRVPSGSAVLGPSGHERSRVLQLVDSIQPARKNVTGNVISVEKILRGLEQDVRGQCEELLGQEAVECLDAEVMGATAYATAEEEAKKHLPLTEESQLSVLITLRHAQQRSSAALTQFLQLPTRLKAIFDITKRLSTEVSNIVPATPATPQATQEASPSWAVARRSQEPMHITPFLEDNGAVAEDAIQREIQSELDRGVSHEEQLKASRAQLRQMSRSMSNQAEKVRSLEKEFVDLQVSRYNEKAQWHAFMQRSSSVPQSAKHSDWGWQGLSAAVAPAVMAVPGGDGAPNSDDPILPPASATTHTGASSASALPPASPAPGTGRRGCQQAGGTSGLHVVTSASEWLSAGVVA